MSEHLAKIMDRWAWLGITWVACLPLVSCYVWAAGRRRTGRGRARANAVRDSMIEGAVALAALPILLVTLTPGGGNGAGLRLVPLTGLMELQGAATADAATQIIGNLVAFLGVGALLPLRWPLRLLDVALSVGAVAIGIEAVQLVALGRVASTDDVMLNVAGAVAGAMLTRRWWLTRARSVRRPRQA